MTHHLRKLSLALLISLATPSVSMAQDDPVAIAQEHFEKGAEWYTQGEYSKAIVEFLKGYNLAPNPMFLYNISLSYAKMDNIEEALKAAERAEREGGLPDEVAIRNYARMNAFRIRLNSDQNAAQMSQIAKVEEKTIVEPDPVEPASGGGFGALGWTGVGLTAIGAGLGVGALLVNAPLADQIDQLEAEAAGGDPARFSELKNQIESDQSTGKILLYAGAGAGAVGLTLIIIELLGSEEEQAQIYVSPQRGGASVGFGTNF